METSVFTKRVRKLLDPVSYRLFQLELAQRPEKGLVIPGSGGLRKIRWEAEGRGKRGGSRIIYYWEKERNLILMLMIYSKADREDLTPNQLRVLRSVVEDELA